MGVGLVVLTVLVVLRYGHGARRLAGGRGGVSAANQVFVYLWLFTAFAVVAPPIDTLARDLYFVHQVQRMLLHMVVPRHGRRAPLYFLNAMWC